MVIQERIQTARHFLEASAHEFAAGDLRQGSEKLWGAASQAVIAIAQERGWDYGSHRSLSVTVRRLYEETGDDFLRAAFSTAEKFHANFYHNFMEDYELEESRPVVHDFVARVLALMETSEPA